MTKPITFNYQDHVKLKADYKDLLIKYAHLKAELTNYEIRCRIAETNAKELTEQMARLRRENEALQDGNRRIVNRCSRLEAELKQLRAESIPVYKYEEVMKTVEAMEREANGKST